MGRGARILCVGMGTMLLSELGRGVSAQGMPALNAYGAKDLASILRMVMTPVPTEAKWGTFTIVPPDVGGPEDNKNRPMMVERGWLIGESGQGYQVVDELGRRRSFRKDRTTFSEGRLAARALEIENQRLAMKRQVEPPYITLPEALIAGWSWERGDQKTAAELLMPRYEEGSDPQWVRVQVRDMLAQAVLPGDAGRLHGKAGLRGGGADWQASGDGRF